MKQLLDFLPVVLFFITYRLSDMITATAVLMVAICVQMGIIWLKHRKLDGMQKFTLIAIILFGGLTLGFQDEMFIKWKVTVVNGLMGLAFIIAPLFTKGEPLIKKGLNAHFDMPDQVWSRLNMAWAAFFIGCGVLNVIVFRTMSDDAWVNFKLFGLMGLMFAFMIGQFIFLKGYLRPMEEAGKEGGDNAEDGSTEKLVEKAAEVTATVESE